MGMGMGMGWVAQTVDVGWVWSTQWGKYFDCEFVVTKTSCL
jgi:hypothetical protein